MDIARLSIVMNQGKVIDQSSILLMKIAIDSAKENVQTMVDILEKAANPNVG